MRDSLADLKDTVRDVQSQCADLRRSVTGASESVEARLQRLEGMLSKQRYARSDVKDLSDFPGIKQPKWYVVDIPFSYGDTEGKRGEVVVSADGAFVCTQVQSYYLCSDTDRDHYSTAFPSPTNLAPGRIMPTSSYRQYLGDMMRFPFSPFTAYSAYSQAGVPSRAYSYNSQDFDFQIEIEGTGRYWASDRIPGHVFGGAVEPSYVAFEGVVENTDRLVVYAYPALAETGVTLDGKVRFVFHGYSISSKLSTSSFLKAQSK